MIVPDRIGHVVIKVRDLERSRKFYTEVMGFSISDAFSDTRAAASRISTGGCTHPEKRLPSLEENA